MFWRQPLAPLFPGANIRVELRPIIEPQDAHATELGAGGGSAVDVDAIGHTGGILAAQAHDLPASRFLIEPRQTTDLAIAPKRYRGRVAAHHDRPLPSAESSPVGTSQ